MRSFRLFLSQRFWHRAIWRATAGFSNKPLRILARIAWLAMVFLVICAFVDGVRIGHHHMIPRGTILPALVGLWFFSALFAFLAVKLVRGLDVLYSKVRNRIYPLTRRNSYRQNLFAGGPDTAASFEQLATPDAAIFFVPLLLLRVPRCFWEQCTVTPQNAWTIKSVASKSRFPTRILRWTACPLCS